MKKLFSKIMVAGLILTAMASFTACTDNTAKNADKQTVNETNDFKEEKEAEAPKEEKQEASEKKVIVMGTNAEFEPFEYRVEGNKVEGFDVEIAEKVAEKLGAELVIEDVTFEGLLPLLESGKIDFIAAGFTYKEERAKSADFSDTYFNAKQTIIVKEDNNDINEIADLDGKIIGCQMGTTGMDIAEEDIDARDVIAFDKGVSAVIDLQNGKLDAVILDNEPATRLVAANSGLKLLDLAFEPEEYVIAVKKGDTELLNAINEVIEELKESGEYDQLVAKYFE